MSNSTISRHATFGEILRMSPKAGKFLKERFNLGCVGCGGAEHETLEQGARAHGLDVEVLLEELRRNI